MEERTLILLRISRREIGNSGIKCSLLQLHLKCLGILWHVASKVKCIGCVGRAVYQTAM